MARPFRHTVLGYSAHLEPAERRLLRTLFSDVLQILGGYVPGATGADHDESVLLEDEEAANRAATESAEPEPTPDLSSASDEDIDQAFWKLVESEPESELDPIPRPEDPAVKKLLPRGRSDEGEHADLGETEFQRLSQDGIRAAKIEDLQRAYAALNSSHTLLKTEEALAFARALNQVRIVLATRLNIEDEATANRISKVTDVSATNTVEDYMALLYNFVSWLLESLMIALSHGELR